MLKSHVSPLLCQIWPGFVQKSSLFYQQSLGMIQTYFTNSSFCRQSSVHSSVYYIHSSIKLSVFISQNVTEIPFIIMLIQMYLLGLFGCYKSMSTTCLHSYISIYFNLILFTDSKHELYLIDSLSNLQIQSKRLVTMSVS